jgi:hypothetical protein
MDNKFYEDLKISSFYMALDLCFCKWRWERQKKIIFLREVYFLKLFFLCVIEYRDQRCSNCVLWHSVMNRMLCTVWVMTNIQGMPYRDIAKMDWATPKNWVQNFLGVRRPSWIHIWCRCTKKFGQHWSRHRHSKQINS